MQLLQNTNPHTDDMAHDSGSCREWQPFSRGGTKLADFHIHSGRSSFPQTLPSRFSPYCLTKVVVKGVGVVGVGVHHRQRKAETLNTWVCYSRGLGSSSAIFLSVLLGSQFCGLIFLEMVLGVGLELSAVGTFCRPSFFLTTLYICSSSFILFLCPLSLRNI